MRTPVNTDNGQFSMSRVTNSYRSSTPLYGHCLHGHCALSIVIDTIYVLPFSSWRWPTCIRVCARFKTFKFIWTNVMTDFGRLIQFINKAVPKLTVMFDQFFLQLFGHVARSPFIKFSASLAYTTVSLFCFFCCHHCLKPSSFLTSYACHYQHQPPFVLLNCRQRLLIVQVISAKNN